MTRRGKEIRTDRQANKGRDSKKDEEAKEIGKRELRSKATI